MLEFQVVPLTEAIVELVKADLGVGLMSRWAVSPYEETGQIVTRRFTKSGLRERWSAVYRPEAAARLPLSRIAERVRDKQHQAWDKARRVLKLAHTRRAKSSEVFGSLNPQFAAAGNRAAATEAVKRLRAFGAQYAQALAAWTSGDQSAHSTASP